MIVLTQFLILTTSLKNPFRVYDGDQQEETKSTIVQEKAKNIVVRSNIKTVQTLIQAELNERDINRDDAVNIAQNAGL